MINITRLRYYCQKVLPLVYDDSLSYYELLCKCVNKINELIENGEGFNTEITTLEAEYADLSDKVEGLINNLVDVIVPWSSEVAYHIFSIVEYQGTNYIAIKDVPMGIMITNTEYWAPANTVIEQINAIGVTVSDVQEEVELASTLYVDVRKYGAVLDGVTDDSVAFQHAISEGNVLLPYNSKVYLANSVTVPSQRIIDFNKSRITGSTNDLFIVENEGESTPATHVIFKNAYINADGGFTPFVITNAYDITFEHIRVIQIKPTHSAIKCCNVFNVTFDCCLLQGDSSVTPYPDNTVGIDIYTDTTPMSWMTVITNIAITNCLLQRFKYGIHLHRNVALGNFEDINIYNQGFSNCDICVFIDLGQVRCLNINDIRAEYSNTVISNVKGSENIKIGQINGFDIRYVIDNTGECSLDSVYINNTGAEPGYIIKSNTGVIRLTGTRYGGSNTSDALDYTSVGHIYGQPKLPVQNITGQTTFTPRLLWRRLFNYTGSNNISNSTQTPFEGLTFDFMVGAGTFVIGSHSITADHKYHTATYMFNDWFIS